MRVSVTGLMRLKPFDESAERQAALKADTSMPFLGVGVVAGACLSLASFVLVLLDKQYALDVLALALSVSAVTAGLEWHAGLKANALNQIFSVVLVLLVFGLFEVCV